MGKILQSRKMVIIFISYEKMNIAERATGSLRQKLLILFYSCASKYLDRLREAAAVGTMWVIETAFLGIPECYLL